MALAKITLGVYGSKAAAEKAIEESNYPKRLLEIKEDHNLETGKTFFVLKLVYDKWKGTEKTTSG